MKKLIFSLIAGVAMIAGTSVESRACSGFLYICNSQMEEFQRQQVENCEQGTAVEVEWLDC